MTSYPKWIVRDGVRTLDEMKEALSMKQEPHGFIRGRMSEKYNYVSHQADKGNLKCQLD